MDDKIVLICATGRSGSTTLQRLINTIPNSNICGENDGAINILLEFYRRIKHTTNMCNGDLECIKNYTENYDSSSSLYEKYIITNLKPAWYNSYVHDDIVQLIRQLIISMFKNNESTKIWGFKELRYVNEIHIIEYFKELFPQTKVIIHIRENLLQQSNSSWHKKDPNSLQFLEKYSSELTDFALKNQEWCYFSTFEKMFDKDNLKNMFKFIDCEEYYNEEKLDEVLSNNIKD